MGLDLTKLDSTIAKMQDVRRLMEDPDARKLLESIFAENGWARTKNGRKPPPSTERGDLKDSVRGAVAETRGKFTAGDLASTLTENGYVFTAKNPKIAVDGVLRVLFKKHFIRVAEVGSGRTPTQYQKTPKFKKHAS